MAENPWPEGTLAREWDDLTRAFTEMFREFVFGRIFVPFMALMALASIGFGIYGLVTLDWRYSICFLIAQVYGYFALYPPFR